MKNGPYTFIVAPKNYPGKKYRGRYAYEHTLVFWKHNGFIPSKGYEIHHINGNHRDNKPENLQLVTIKEHRKIHADISSAKSKTELVCNLCGVKYYKTASVVKTRKKRTKMGTSYCSRKCQHKSMVGSTRVGSRDLAVNQARKPS